MGYLTPSIFYFLFFGALSCLWPYMALYYRGIGLSGAEVGMLTGLTPLVTMLGGPFWTGLADSTRRHKAVMSFAILGSVALVTTLLYFRAFWLLLALAAAFAFVNAPISSLADNATMSMLGEKSHLYGRVRLWGAVGWGLVAPLGGFLVERYGVPAAFYAYATLTVLCLLVALGLPFQVHANPTPFSQGLGALMREKRWVFFLGMVFVAGAGTATVNNYLFVHMSGLGLNQTLMGLVLTVSTISEVPVLFFGGRLLKRFGPIALLLLAMFAIGARLLLYSFSTDSWHFMTISLLHGLTFPLIWVAGVSYAAQVAPAGLGATAQGLFGSTLMGFGAGAGGFLGGLLIDRVNTSGMYLFMGLGLLLFSLVLIPFLLRKKQ